MLDYKNKLKSAFFSQKTYLNTLLGAGWAFKTYKAQLGYMILFLISPFKK